MISLIKILYSELRSVVGQGLVSLSLKAFLEDQVMLGEGEKVMFIEDNLCNPW